MSFPLAALLFLPVFCPEEVASQAKLSKTTEPSLSLDPEDKFGQSATRIGDINGDGYDDVVSGAPYADDGGENRGAIHLLFLGAGGSVLFTRTISDTKGGFTGTLSNDDQFGWSVASLGDLDGDSVPDIAVGARHDDDGGVDRGAVWILFLRSDGTVKSHQKISETKGGFEGELEDAGEFGWSITSPGDIDGNGTPDLAVGVQEPLELANVWPGTPGTLISGGLPNNWEPSGAVWNSVTERLILVSDQGRVAQMDLDGSNVDIDNLSGDFEGVAIKDPASPFVYVGVENPDSIREFNLATGQMTGKEWNLTPWMTGSSNAGLEALTYAKGQFYAGHEDDGDAYVFNISGTSTVSLDHIIPSPENLMGLSGLHYEDATDTLYWLFRNRRIIETDLDGNTLRQWPINALGQTQEGITLITDCPSGDASIVMARDSGKVFRYEEYPVNCFGPEILPGRGALWTMILDSSGQVLHETKVGFGLGGFGGHLSSGDRFGTSLAGLGDINGDGTPDLAVGAPNDDDGGHDRGALWFLELTGNGSVKANHKVSHTSGSLPPFLKNDDQFGWSLAAAGDLDGDGFNDLLAGSPGVDGTENSLGAVDLVYLGENGTVIDHGRIDESAGSLGNELEGFDQFGTALVGDIDLDANGSPDLIVGAAFDDDGGANAGALWELVLESSLGSITPYGCDSSAAGSLSVLSGSPQAGSTLVLGMQNPNPGVQANGSIPLLVVAATPPTNYPCGLLLANTGLAGPGSAGEFLLGIQPNYPNALGPVLSNGGDLVSMPITLPDGLLSTTPPLYFQVILWDPFAVTANEIGLTNGLRVQLGS